MSSPIMPPGEMSQSVSFSAVDNEASQENQDSGINTTSECSTSEIVLTQPFSGFIHKNSAIYVRCSYLITALNLEIKNIIFKSSPQDKLFYKQGIEKSSSIENTSSSTAYAKPFSSTNHPKGPKHKHQFKINIPQTTYPSTSSSQKNLNISMISPPISSTPTQPKSSHPFSTPIYSKPEEQTSKKETVPFTSTSQEKEKKESGCKQNVHASSIRYLDDNEETKSSERKEDDSSQDKDQEKEKEHHQKNQEEENKNFISKLIKKQRLLHTKGVSSNVTANKFSEINNVVKNKIHGLTLDHYNTELMEYALQTSLISQIFDMRISNLDVLILFIEVMKLALKSRQQQFLFRSEERLLQLTHMQEVVESFKEQANCLLFTGLTAGLLAVVSGVSPIFGQIKGEWALGHLSKVFSRLKDMASEKFFESTSKITLATSEMAKATGQIQTAFSESHRTYDDHYREHYKIDSEEKTRNIEEIKESWRALENFIYQSLQMQHETIKQLYQ